MQIGIEANVIFNNKFNFNGIYAWKTICISMLHSIIFNLHDAEYVFQPTKMQASKILQLKLFFDK